MTLHALVERTRRAIETHSLFKRGETIVVGVSGGADSVALLDVLVQLAAPVDVTLHVAHLDHRLRPTSADDAQWVANLAGRLGVPVTIGQADVAGYAAAARLSLEEAARQVRYAFLSAVAQAVGATRVTVAHHAQDQAETVLLHLLRGAGLAGLRGMASLAPLPPTAQVVEGGWLQSNVRAVGAHRRPKGPLPVDLARPWLDMSKVDILTYIAERGLTFREDESNTDARFTRNRIRHDLLPLLETYNTGIIETLGRTARCLADDYAVIEAEADEIWPHLARPAGQGVEFDLGVFEQLPLAVRRQTVRRAVDVLRGLRDLSADHVEDVVELAATGEAGERRSLPGLTVARGYRNLYMGRGEVPTPEWPFLATDTAIAVRVPGETPLPKSPWVLRVTVEPADALPDLITAVKKASRRRRYETTGETVELVAVIDAQVAEGGLALRPRQRGESFQPLGLAGRSRTLHEYMIDARIPREVRDRVPVLVNAQHVIWVCGFRLDHRARVTTETQTALRLEWVKIKDS